MNLHCEELAHVSGRTRLTRDKTHHMADNIPHTVAQFVALRSHQGPHGLRGVHVRENGHHDQENLEAQVRLKEGRESSIGNEEAVQQPLHVGIQEVLSRRGIHEKRRGEILGQ
jgi:hypothetical protein